MFAVNTRPAAADTTTMCVTRCPVSTASATAPVSAPASGSSRTTWADPSVVTQTLPSSATATPWGRVCSPRSRVRATLRAATSTTVTVFPGRGPVP